MAPNSSNKCAAVDRTFGPYAGEHCRGGFDFTLLFEEAIFSLIPISLILLIAPIRLFFLWRKQIKVSSSLILPVKLVSQNLEQDRRRCSCKQKKNCLLGEEPTHKLAKWVARCFAVKGMLTFTITDSMDFPHRLRSCRPRSLDSKAREKCRCGSLVHS